MLRTWQAEEGTRVAVVTTIQKCAVCNVPLKRTNAGRFGEVQKVGRKWLHVKMDSGPTLLFKIHGQDGFNTHVPELRACR